KNVIQNALRKAFSPEFLNRVDDIIMFKSLGRPEIHKIIDLELAKLFTRIEDLGYKLDLTEKAKDFIVDKGYDEKFGARPLKRALQKYIEDPLAEEIIQSNLHEGDTIQMDLNEAGDGLEVVISKLKRKDKTK
ncbi:MAG: ATP-dependent Clp protease ATP-binding subunit, partial [Crocinitomicaceae bacterium]|nr:ATP-dependent Clp protease ATP-binding subunit [Crocinitomicaceae bacterium]